MMSAIHRSATLQAAEVRTTPGVLQQLYAESLRKIFAGVANSHRQRLADPDVAELKEGVGKATGDKDTENEGKVDQAKSSLKDAGEKVKDALKN
jgi:hypothetical protein